MIGDLARCEAASLRRVHPMRRDSHCYGIGAAREAAATQHNLAYCSCIKARWNARIPCSVKVWKHSAHKENSDGILKVCWALPRWPQQPTWPPKAYA